MAKSFDELRSTRIWSGDILYNIADNQQARQINI